jgi:O-antigen/teichoic acid export membrane protein
MGKDTLTMILAQALSIVAAAAVHIGMGRILGPEPYGEFGVIMSLLAVLEVFLARGIRDAVTKYTAEFPERSASIQRQGLAIGATFGGIVFLLYGLMARPIALAFHDVNLTRPLLISALIVPFIALYSVFIGHLSGKGEFGKRALAMNTQSLGKVAGVYILAVMGFGLHGAVSGYVISYGLALVVAYVYSRERRREAGSFPAADLVSFAIPVVVFSILLSLLMNLDIFFVRSLLKDAEAAGYYTSALALTRAPYFVFYAFAITLLPIISRLTSSGRFEEASRYVNKSMRYLMILLAPLAFFTSSLSGPIIRLVYSDRYLPGARPLAILIFGLTFLTFFSVLVAVINGSGRPKTSMALAGAVLPLDLALNLILIPRFGLSGAAAATTVSSFAGTIAAAVIVQKEFGTLIRGASFLKILASSLVFLAAPRLFPVGGWGLIPYGLGLFALYLLLLVLLEEISRDDLSLFSNLWTGLVRRNP